MGMIWERRAVPGGANWPFTGLQYSWGYSIGQQKQGSTRGFFCENSRDVFLRQQARTSAAGPVKRGCCRPRTVSESESDGGFVEFGDVDFGVSGFDGVRHPGGLWNPSRGVRADAPAAETGGGEDTAGSGAGVVDRVVSFCSRPCPGADGIDRRRAGSVCRWFYPAIFFGG